MEKNLTSRRCSRKIDLDSVAAFDMFPQTHHVETVARLTHHEF